MTQTKTTTRKATDTKAIDAPVDFKGEFRKIATIIVTMGQLAKGRGTNQAIEYAEHLVEKIYGTTGK
mgnify:CR=1 FL=1|jgi:hypothetical protein